MSARVRAARRRSAALPSALAAAILAAIGADARADDEPSAASPPSPSAASPAPPSAADAARLAEAEERFKSGVAHFRLRKFDLALVQFLQSQTLHPSWRASSNAAACLQSLKRPADALDMFELALRDFSASMPEKVKATVQKFVIGLRKETGTIEITGAQPGATLLIDGRRRGEYPAPGPFNVLPGTHVVRVYKDGFDPFEATVIVKPGQSSAIDAATPPLLRAGVLRVREASGMRLDVYVDGFVVGVTPWVGAAAVGEHSLMLGGDANFGTLPLKVSIDEAKTREVELAAKDLGASIRVAPTPGDARVSLNTIFVGRGVFEGRLPAGASALTIEAEGYLTQTKALDLKPGSRETITVELRPDPASPKWRAPPKLAFELAFGLPIARSLGGDVGRACAAPCDRGVGSGAYGALLAGYELGDGLGFGAQAGYLTLSQSTAARPSTIDAVGRPAAGKGTLDDTVEVGGYTVGAYGSYTINERFAARLRLGVGAVLGAVTDVRSGTFGLTRSPALTYGVGPATQSTSTAWLLLSPEVRAGLRTKKNIELSAGFSSILLIAPRAVAWDHEHAVNAASDGYGRLQPDALTGRLIFAVMPSIGARYDF